MTARAVEAKPFPALIIVPATGRQKPGNGSQEPAPTLGFRISDSPVAGTMIKAELRIEYESVSGMLKDLKHLILISRSRTGEGLSPGLILTTL